MAAKRSLRKTLPKDLPKLMQEAEKSGSYEAVQRALEKCQPDARGGYGEGTALMMKECTLELARWLLDRGADIHATNRWGRTALHESASARYHHRITPKDWIGLGADVHRRANGGETPLHCAANGKNVDAVESLLEAGSEVDALADGVTAPLKDATPLEYALVQMSNIDFVAMVPVVRALLGAGAEVTLRAKDAAKIAAEKFEFHREGFNKESVEEFSVACAALCELLSVPAPGPRRRHDGTSPIIAPGDTWQAKHRELWDYLVPSSGACETVQGEVIRIAGRVGDELHRNGGANWNRDYPAMLKAFCAHVGSHRALEEDLLKDCERIAKEVHDDHDLSDRLAELAVLWVGQNPDPIALDKPGYGR